MRITGNGRDFSQFSRVSGQKIFFNQTGRSHYPGTPGPDAPGFEIGIRQLTNTQIQVLRFTVQINQTVIKINLQVDIWPFLGKVQERALKKADIHIAWNGKAHPA